MKWYVNANIVRAFSVIVKTSRRFVSSTNIRAGEEVFTNYGYRKDEQYTARGISLDWFCEKGTCI